jgi:hypothetical protein
MLYVGNYLLFFMGVRLDSRPNRRMCIESTDSKVLRRIFESETGSKRGMEKPVY